MANQVIMGSINEQIQMGIGPIGNDNVILKRKFRWTFRVQDICRGNDQNGKAKETKAVVPEFYVKVAARPNLDIEETEINFLNGKMFIPGKGTWQEISVTYYDAAVADNQPLWDWLASVYQYPDPDKLHQGSRQADYSGTGILAMYDGCGQPLEVWNLYGIWPKSINFGELDYASSEEATIEVSMRFNKVKYQSLCPVFTPAGCCSPCDSNSTSGNGRASAPVANI